VKLAYVGTAAVLLVLAGLGLMINTDTWLDEEEWSALGQWAGGLGAVAAVCVALWIAHRDWRSASETALSAQRARAFLIITTCGEQGVVVVNHGPDPVTQLVVPRVGGSHGGITADPEEFPPEVRAVLMPNESWTVRFPVSGRSGLADFRVLAPSFLDESEVLTADVRWTDLQGTHWRRIGDQEPKQTSTSDWRSPTLSDVIEKEKPKLG